MPKRIVGLIGNGKGPEVATQGECYVVIEGLRMGGIVTIFLDSGEQLVAEEDGSLPIGRAQRVSFEAKDASRELICRILMES